MTAQDKLIDPCAAGEAGGHAGRAASQRERAEASLRQSAALSPEELAALSPHAIGQLVHELHVHQIELAMQNEQLRESQAALDAVRERYFDLYDMAPVGYCTISEQGLIVQANLTAAKLFGIVRGALLNQPLSRRILRQDQDIYYLHRKRLLENGEAQSFELRMIKNDGTDFWVHLTTTAGQDALGVPELRVVMSDISKRKQTEAELALFQSALQDNNVELEQANVVAKKANQAKSDFLSGMSHELRTPLHAILGFGQLMDTANPPPTQEQKKSIDQILKAGWYLLKLVNEVLDLAVIDSGKRVLSLERVSLGDVVGECQAMVEPLAQQRGIGAVFPTAGELPYFVQADPTWLKQALINLLSNAIKYNSAGGTVTLDVNPRAAGRIRIGVRDTGAGLTPENLTQLFQPFNRLGQEASGEEGTGIGLIVCKRLVELMGGAIGVESTPGAGSLFWIELGLMAPPDAAQAAAPTTAPADTPIHGPDGGHRLTLLYVEDNPANLMLVEVLIARQPDIRLLSAQNAARGIAMARNFLPDIILMDINLPDISGIEALKMLAADPATAHIPVIALSANAMPADIEKGLDAGFFRYMTKPIKVTEFMQMLALDLPRAR
jgi:PAS domain S-box-containing protein